jgi:hypothetical protein
VIILINELAELKYVGRYSLGVAMACFLLPVEKEFAPPGIKTEKCYHSLIFLGDKQVKL